MQSCSALSCTGSVARLQRAVVRLKGENHIKYSAQSKHSPHFTVTQFPYVWNVEKGTQLFFTFSAWRRVWYTGGAGFALVGIWRAGGWRRR